MLETHMGSCYFFCIKSKRTVTSHTLEDMIISHHRKEVETCLHTRLRSEQPVLTMHLWNWLQVERPAVQIALAVLAATNKSVRK